MKRNILPACLAAVGLLHLVAVCPAPAAAAESGAPVDLRGYGKTARDAS